MGGLIDIAGSVLTQATFRVEVASHNLSNVTTPGYKRQVSFAQLLDGAAQAPVASAVRDLSAGKLTQTGNPYDLSVMGEGLFAVSSDTGVFYTRQGQFERGADGRLLTASGYALQAEGGGDLMLSGRVVQILSDGVVVEDGQATSKVAVVGLAQGVSLEDGPDGLFAAPGSQLTALSAGQVRQGAFETSNVSSGDEMVAMMSALRQAEAGQRLINVYDELIGRAISAFGPGTG